MKTASCPGCGAPIEFAIGSAVVRICEHCRSAVARTDRDLQNLGRVADLIDTGSPLRTMMAGKYQGIGFRLAGRVQLRHDSGAIWDEWYAAFDDGRWGWLDEADGNYYVTFETGDDGAKPAHSLQLGDVVDNMTVFEIGTAEVVSAEGEMPWRAAPGATYTYADLSGAGDRFATIEDLDGRTVVFKGKETSLSGLGLEKGGPRRAPRTGSVKLSCTKCGGVLNVVAQDISERIACNHCGALHQIQPGSTLAFVAAQKQFRAQTVIPLGTTGTIDGVQYVVAGFMRREASAAGERWSWDEYLLFNRETGFRYLTHDENHWSFEEPVLPGVVLDATTTGVNGYINVGEQRFRLFENSTPSVTLVLGEFPWRVEVGEKVKTADYILPPRGVSKELYSKKKSQEANYSVARYMKPDEVEKAFGLTALPRPYTVGAMQPNPYPMLALPWALAMVALLAIAIVIAMFVPRHLVYKDSFDVVSGKQWTTRAFTLEGNRHLHIRSTTNVDLGGEITILGEFEGPAAEAFEIWMGYETGVDDEGRWTEDSRKSSVYLAALPAGQYTLDMQAQTNVAAARIDLEIYEGAFRWSHLLLAAIAISIIPALTGFFWFQFESRRWRDSDYSPFPELSTEDDDE